MRWLDKTIPQLRWSDVVPAACDLFAWGSAAAYWAHVLMQVKP